MAYRSKMEGVRGILVEACSILNAAAIEYVVAGGWVPYLRAQPNALHHPGTHDVDLLFNDDAEPIRESVKALLLAGYVPSAKHEFQFLKKLDIAGQDFVYNIDLMHPAEGKFGAGMFHDILDLGIREDYDPLTTHTIKSICFQSAKIIFDQALWSPFAVDGELPSGAPIQCAVPLMDEAALVLSKSRSVDNIKRERDAFDIYFVLTGPGGSAAAARLRQLAAKYPQVAQQLVHLKAFLEQQGPTFDGRVETYAKRALLESPASQVLSLLF